MAVVNIDKNTGRVVDINQYYDERFFENRLVPDEMVAEFTRTKEYEFRNGSVVERVVAQTIRLEAIRLDTGVDFSDYHTHRQDQVVIVLHGAVLIDEETKSTRVEAFTSTKILARTRHKIVGAEPGSLFITVAL